MPLSQLTPEEADYLRQQGIDPSGVTLNVPDEQMSMPRAALARLTGGAGSILGGGGGAMAGAMAGGRLGVIAGAAIPALGETGIGELGGGILGAAIGGLGGAFLGGKAQQAVVPSGLEQQLEQQAQQAQEQHPIVSGATDIAAGALASGGMFSPGTTLAAGRGLIGKLGGRAMTDIESQALKNVALQSVINPAINAGGQVALTGTLPSGKELLAQSLGGALFAKPSALGRWAGRVGRSGETSPETTKLPPQVGPEQGPALTSPYLDSSKVNDYMVKQRFNKEFNPKPSAKEITDPLAYDIAMTQYKAKAQTPVNEMRQALHTKWVQDNSTRPEQTAEPAIRIPQTPVEYEGGEMPQTKALPFESNPPPNKEAIIKQQQIEQAYQEKLRQDMAAQPEKPVSPNTLRLTAQNLLPSSIARPEVQATGEGRALPITGETRTPAEIEQDRLEGSGAKYSGPFTEQHIPLPPEIGQHIATPSEHPTTGSVLQKIADSPNHPMATLARHLSKMMTPSDAKVPWSVNDKLENSRYLLTGNKVEMSPQHLGDARVVMEEGMHSITSNKLDMFRGYKGAELKNRMDRYLKEGDNEPIKDIIKGYYKMADALGLSDTLFKDYEEPGLAGQPHKMFNQHIEAPTVAYAMGDLDEFVAHMFKNEQFQHLANNVEYGEGKTVWQHIVDAVRRLLGVDIKQGSVLDHVLRSSAELISQERPEVANAIQKPSTSRILPHSQEATGSTGSERGRMGPSNEGEASSEARYSAPEQKAVPSEKSPLDEDRYMGRIGKLTRAVLDKVGDIPHGAARTLATAGKQTMNEIDRLRGQWRNPIIQAGNKLTQRDKGVLNTIKDTELATGKPHPEMLEGQSSALKNYYETAKRIYSENGDYRLESKEPVLRNGVATLLRKDPSYWAGMANQRVEDIYRRNIDKPAMDKLDAIFDKWNQSKLGMNPSESAERIKNWKQSMQGDLKGSDISHQDYFNASRKAMGSPLPPEFREADPVKNDARYFDRQAVDNAHYRFIEKNPEAMSALGVTKDAWGNAIPEHKEQSLANNPDVKNMLAQFHGEPHGPAEYGEQSISSVFTQSLIAGPPLEVHKLVSNQVKAISLADNPYQLSRSIAYALTHVAQGYQHSVETGVTKLTASSVRDMFDGSLSAAERLNGLSKAIRSVSTLGDLTTKLNAGLLHSYFEQLMPSKVIRANAGDRTNQQFIRKLDPTYEVGKTYDPASMRQLAGLAVSYTHGTGDIRTLPGWMMGDSEVSGFFKLAHWSVAQTNNFMKDIWTPALRGDVKPLIMGAFGSLAGGYIIKELRQDLQGKKNPIPSLGEIASSSRGLSGNPGLLAYNAMAAMMYSGFGGLLSQVAKYPFDFAYKITPYGATFPLDAITTDLVDTFHYTSETISNDPNLNLFSLAKAVANHIFTSDVQLSRMAINQLINSGAITGLQADKKLLADKMSSLRRFDMTEGLYYEDLGGGSGSNPYMNLEQKQFKMEQNPDKALQQLPALVNNIVETYKGNPDLMMSKLKALKTNQYATFPSMETMPLSFMKYVGYLQRLEGPEQAQAALQDYLHHKVINQVKASAVP